MITINVGELILKIVTDSSGLTTGLSNAEKQVVASSNAMANKFKSIGTLMTGVGTVVTGALTTMVLKTVAAGDAMWDMHQRTGIAVEDLSALSYVAQKSGTDMQTVETSLRFLTKAMDDAATGTGAAGKTFKDLGISVKNTDGTLRPAMEVFKEVADKIVGMTNESKQTITAMDLFGSRMGTQMIPMLKLGKDEINRLIEVAKNLGIVLTGEDAKAADEFAEQMDVLKVVLAGAGRDIATILIPPIQNLMKQITEGIGIIRKWADDNKMLVATLVQLAGILGPLVAVGGPILMAYAGYMKIKIAMDAMAAASAPATAGLINMNAVLLLATANYMIWNNVIKEYNKIVESAKAIRKAEAALVIAQAGAMDKLQKAYNLTDVEMTKAWENLKNGINALDGVRESTTKLIPEVNNLSESIKAMGTSFEDIDAVMLNSVITGKKMSDQQIAIMELNKKMSDTDSTETQRKIDDLDRECIALLANMDINLMTMEQIDQYRAKMLESIIANSSEQKKQLSDMTEATKTYADTMQPIYDKLYEMNHTVAEVAVYALNAEKEAAIAKVEALKLSVDEQGKALVTIEEWYNKEIEIIKAKLIEEADALIKIAKTSGESADKQVADITRIKDALKTQIDQVNAVAIATEASAARQVSALKTIMTAQGALLTNINNIQSAGSYAEAQTIVAANTAKPKPTPVTTTKPVTTTPVVTTTPATIPTSTPTIPTPYVSNQVTTDTAGNITSITLPGGGTISVGKKSYQLGTSYVPKTGLYMLHQGEEVRKANQNTTNTNNNSFSPNVVINVSGGGNAQNIAFEVKKVLEDSARQFRRSGFELVPGRT